MPPQRSVPTQSDPGSPRPPFPSLPQLQHLLVFWCLDVFLYTSSLGVGLCMVCSQRSPRNLLSVTQAAAWLWGSHSRGATSAPGWYAVKPSGLYSWLCPFCSPGNPGPKREHSSSWANISLSKYLFDFIWFHALPRIVCLIKLFLVQAQLSVLAIFNIVFVKWELAHRWCFLQWSTELLHGDRADLLLGSYKLRGVNHSCFTSSVEN